MSYALQTPALLAHASKIALASACSAALLTLALCPSALAQAAPPTRTLTRSSPPLFAAGGDKLALCAANNLAAATVSPTAAAPASTGSTTFNVTLKILNGVTGAVVAQGQIALPPLGAEEPPDPCITFAVPSATFAPTTSLFVARIELNPQPLPPGICRQNALTASLQAYSVDASGNPTNIRTLVLEPPDPCVFRPFFRR